MVIMPYVAVHFNVYLSHFYGENSKKAWKITI